MVGPPDDHWQSGGDVAHADGAIGTDIALLLRHSQPKAAHRHLVVLGTEGMAGTAELLHEEESSVQQSRDLLGGRLGTEEECRNTVRVPGHVPGVHLGRTRYKLGRNLLDPGRLGAGVGADLPLDVGRWQWAFH